MSRREFEKASEGGDACVFPAFLRAGRRIAEHPGAGRSARSAASVMHPVAPNGIRLVIIVIRLRKCPSPLYGMPVLC